MSTEERPYDTVDLRQTMGALGRWWREILLIALLLGVLAGGAVWLLGRSQAPVYASAADVAILRTATDVTFDERFSTQWESVAGQTIVSRRNALLALATSPALAEQVLAAVGTSLPVELQTPAALAAVVSAAPAGSNGTRGESDLIRITAQAPSPEAAATIATAWARAYVDNVNRVYGQVPDELLASIEEEATVAEANYAAAQLALEEQRGLSLVDELTRRLSDTEATLNVLRRGRQDLLNDLVDRTVEGSNKVADAVISAQAENLTAPYVSEQAGRRAIVLAWIDALYLGQAQVISEQGARDRDLLAGAYTRWVQATRALMDAEALRAQVAATTDETAPGSSVLVLSLLKLQALTQALDPQTPPTLDVTADPIYNERNQASAEDAAASSHGMVQNTQPVQMSVGTTPLQLQLDDNNQVGRDVLLADADALIETLTAYVTTLEIQIAALSEQMLGGGGYTLLEPTTPADSALVNTIQEQTASLLSGTILTGTAGMAAANVTDLGPLFRLDNLSSLSEASTEDTILTETIGTLEGQARQINAQLEAERATLTRLQQQRDLALDSYSAVNSKIAEMALARAAGSSEVRFAAPGVPPAGPLVGRSPLLIGGAALLAGLLLGVVFAFLADLMGRRPFLART